jgi:hypothetical protein
MRAHFVIISLLLFCPNLVLGQEVGINVEEYKKGEIVVLDYPPAIYLGNTTTILVVFRNTGSVDYYAKIMIKLFNSTGEEPFIIFEDVIVPLNPGEERSFVIKYAPPKVDLYFIEARVEYDRRVAERYGAFYVLYPPIFEIVPIEYPIPYPVPVPPPPGIVNISVEYEKEYTLSEGQSLLIPIIVKNIGTASLHNIKISLYYKDLIIDVFPKFLFELKPGENSTFLLSVLAPKGVYGIKKISFEVISAETTFTGEITLNITAVLTREELLQKISTNEFIIMQLESEIEKAKARGLDTSKAEEFLENAKKYLQEAKELLDLGKLQDAAEKLLEKDRYLEEVVKELSRIKVPVVVFPFYIIWIILLLLLVLLLLLLLVWALKKHRERRERRPRILRRLGR